MAISQLKSAVGIEGVLSLNGVSVHLDKEVIVEFIFFPENNGRTAYGCLNFYMGSIALRIFVTDAKTLINLQEQARLGTVQFLEHLIAKRKIKEEADGD
jgi:hypothetical protein